MVGSRSENEATENARECSGFMASPPLTVQRWVGILLCCPGVWRSRPAFKHSDLVVPRTNRLTGDKKISLPDGICRRRRGTEDRKSTRLNSSHRCISYAVFCLKKK